MDFAASDGKVAIEPDNKRLEEQFMYKYMQMRPPKKAKKSAKHDSDEEDIDDSDEFAEDPEMEKFADEEMQREMKRMASGAPGGMPDSEEEDVSLDGMSREDSIGSDDDDEGGFFSGEDDLQDVEIDKDDDDDGDDDGEDIEG